MEVNQNQNQNNEILSEETDTTQLPLLRKRSSIKTRSSVKESGFRSSLTINNGQNRKISFMEDTNIKDEKISEKSYSNSKTRFSSIVKIIKN
jgi:hypothetical protein